MNLLSAEPIVGPVQQGVHLIPLCRVHVRQVRALAKPRAVLIDHRNAPAGLVVLDGLPEAASRHPLEDRVPCDAPHHRPVPLRAPAVGADWHTLSVEPVGDGRAVEARPQAAEPFLIDWRRSRVLLPVVVRSGVRRFQVTEDRQGGSGAEVQKPVHQFVLEALGRVRVVADMVAAGGDDILLPAVLCGVDAIVGGQHASAVIDGDAAQSDGFGPADHPTDVLNHQQVQLSAPQEGLDLGQFRPVEALALASGGDDSVLDGTRE